MSSDRSVGEWVIALLVLSLLLILLGFTLLRYTMAGRFLCEGIGNRWIMSQRRCETRACVARHDCMASYENVYRCGLLPPDVSETELIFQLGEPTRREGSVLYFSGSPGSSVDIRAELDERRHAIRLDCNPIPPAMP